MSEKSISEYIRRHNGEKFGSLGPSDRFADDMLAPGDWTGKTAIRYIQTPPGATSTHDLHSHPFDQVYFMLKGTMEIYIEDVGREWLHPGDIIVFPAGVLHQSWNNTDEPTVHIALNGVGAN